MLIFAVFKWQKWKMGQGGPGRPHLPPTTSPTTPTAPYRLQTTNMGKYKRKDCQNQEGWGQWQPQLADHQQSHWLGAPAGVAV